MRNYQEKASLLRKSGKSYREIHKKLGTPVSTLSDWFGGKDWSNKIRIELTEKVSKQHKIRIENLNKIRGQNLKKLYNEARSEAIMDFENLKYHPLFISNIMLYWGEGDKASLHRVSLTNSDPFMIKLFVVFLKEICGINKQKIKIWLLLYPDLNNEKCKEYWIKTASLKGIMFNKSIVINGKHKTRKLSYGVCTVVVSSRYLKEKMLKWLELFSARLLDENYYKLP